MSTEIDQIVYYYFTGLKVLDENDSSIYRIKLFNDDKSLCKEKLLPKIDHGTGDNTLIHGEGLTAAHINQTVIGKYNENKSTSIFEIGVGVSDANRKNAIELQAPKRLKAVDIKTMPYPGFPTDTGCRRCAGSCRRQSSWFRRCSAK